MHIEIIRTADQWNALKNEWQDLLAVAHQNTPFLTFGFQQAWWQHLGGGEWTDAELYILTGRQDDGALVGIAPLFTVEDGGLKRLLFIGSHEISDFLDFIAPADRLDEFVQAVLAHLQQLPADEWDSLELYNLLDDSASQATLEMAAKAQGWQFNLEALQPSPYLPVPASLDAYGEVLGSKQAHELRRKLRRAARNPEPVEMEMESDPDHLPQCLTDFFELMAQEEDKDNFLSPAMRAQMDAIAHAGCEGGWLQLAFLKVGDQRVAGYMNFDYGNRIWAYNSGFKNGYASLSPGWLIMADMLQWCIDNGRQVFDFMRGDEEYKYRFGAVNRFVHKVTITR